MVLAPEIDDHSDSSASDVGDQRVILHAVSWDEYDKLCELFDERPGVRMTYLEGTLEIMVPSREHERRKTLTARLVEAYADHFGIDLNGFGNTTYRRKAKKRGLEPDECYVLGEEDKDFPDIAIEVVQSRKINKLEVYRGLGVREVWSLEKGRFVVYVLEGTGDGACHATREQSTLLPGLDLELVARFVGWQNQRKAVAAFREALVKAHDANAR
jgi:Uma2 family endonuclease